MSERSATLFFRAKVEWIPQSKGGRKAPPGKGARYCPIIDIADDMTWSIDFICPDFAESSEIRFRFFVDEAPQEKVRAGEKYKLLEGNRATAVAEIVSVESEEE